AFNFWPSNSRVIVPPWGSDLGTERGLAPGERLAHNRFQVLPLRSAVSAIYLGAVDDLAEREIAVAAASTEVHAVAPVDELQGHERAPLKETAGYVAVGGVPGRRTLHAAQCEVQRAPPACLDTGAITVDGHALAVSTPAADERTTGLRERAG